MFDAMFTASRSAVAEIEPSAIQLPITIDKTPAGRHSQLIEIIAIESVWCHTPGAISMLSTVGLIWVLFTSMPALWLRTASSLGRYIS